MAGNPKANSFAGIVLFAGTPQEFTVKDGMPVRISGAQYQFFSSVEGHFVDATDAEVKAAIASRDKAGEEVIGETLEEIFPELAASSKIAKAKRGK